MKRNSRFLDWIQTLCPFSMRTALRQAMDIFFISSLIALLFNSFFTYGINLKVHPVIPISIQQILKKSKAIHYAGWNAPVSPTTPHINKIMFINLQGAKNRFDQHVTFLDARSPMAYRAGHIEGALNFYSEHLNQSAQKILPHLLNKKKELVTYCEGGSCDLAIRLAQFLHEQGYSDVDVFVGGFPQWAHAHYPIHQGSHR